MPASVYRVISERDEDCFGLADDYETALGLARSAARERAGEAILLTLRGSVIRHLTLAPDGQLAEEEIRP